MMRYYGFSSEELLTRCPSEIPAVATTTTTTPVPPVHGPIHTITSDPVYVELRRVFARFFVVKTVHITEAITKYHPLASEADKTELQYKAEGWRSAWQSKTGRQLKELVAELYRTHDLKGKSDAEVRRIIDAEYENSNRMMTTVFFQVAPVVDVEAILRDKGPVGKLYFQWYSNVAWAVYLDMKARFDRGDFSTSPPLRQPAYNIFRSVARSKEWDEIGINDIAMLDRGDRATRKRKPESNDHIDQGRATKMTRLADKGRGRQKLVRGKKHESTGNNATDKIGHRIINLTPGPLVRANSGAMNQVSSIRDPRRFESRSNGTEEVRDESDGYPKIKREQDVDDNEEVGK